jgi:hypothetical protein
MNIPLDAGVTAVTEVLAPAIGPALADEYSSPGAPPGVVRPPSTDSSSSFWNWTDAGSTWSFWNWTYDTPSISLNLPYDAYSAPWW